MDMFICNKCFAVPNRGKKPFCLTQCGHIYCQRCIQQAGKQCPLCHQLNVFSVELQQPSLAKVENFFAPLNESFESLHKIYGFQSNQTKIMVQRFKEIDKKYEELKSHYYNFTQNMKLLRDKYIKLKTENVELKKKLISSEQKNIALNSLSDTSTPVSVNTQRAAHIRNAPNSYFSSCGTNISSHSFNVGRGRTNILEGFRTPYPQSVKSASSRETSNLNSTYTFRRKI